MRIKEAYVPDAEWEEVPREELKRRLVSIALNGRQPDGKPSGRGSTIWLVEELNKLKDVIQEIVDPVVDEVHPILGGPRPRGRDDYDPFFWVPFLKIILHKHGSHEWTVTILQEWPQAIPDPWFDKAIRQAHAAYVKANEEARQAYQELKQTYRARGKDLSLQEWKQLDEPAERAVRSALAEVDRLEKARQKNVEEKRQKAWKVFKEHLLSL